MEDTDFTDETARQDHLGADSDDCSPGHYLKIWSGWTIAGIVLAGLALGFLASAYFLKVLK